MHWPSHLINSRHSTTTCEIDVLKSTSAWELSNTSKTNKQRKKKIEEKWENIKNYQSIVAAKDEHVYSLHHFFFIPLRKLDFDLQYSLSRILLVKLKLTYYHYKSRVHTAWIHGFDIHRRTLPNWDLPIKMHLNGKHINVEIVFASLFACCFS